MSNQSSNSAKQSNEAEPLEIDEPSMDEILASIKKIISDEEEADTALQDRDQYSHPEDHSNSNVAEQSSLTDAEVDLEADLEAAIEAELQETLEEPESTDATAPSDESGAVAEDTANSDDLSETVQAVEKPSINISVRPGGKSVAKVETAKDFTPLTAQVLQERVEKIRSEVSEASSGLSTDPRLEKYRVRGKLKMESLAAAKPLTDSTPSAPPVAPVPEQPAVSPAVAAGPILPTTHTIAQEMAKTMLEEKEQEIQTLLANMMRPTIRKWLNDNLPVMVEKLVREEIERVSRGKKASEG